VWISPHGYPNNSIVAQIVLRSALKLKQVDNHPLILMENKEFVEIHIPKNIADLILKHLPDYNLKNIDDYAAKVLAEFLDSLEESDEMA
jgi:hypothetical protein